MDRSRMLWDMTAEQFAAFDMQLYLDTHKDDKTALRMLSEYQRRYAEKREEYESLYGALSSDYNKSTDSWGWLNNPWPWEREAN